MAFALISLAISPSGKDSFGMKESSALQAGQLKSNLTQKRSAADEKALLLLSEEFNEQFDALTAECNGGTPRPVARSCAARC